MPRTPPLGSASSSRARLHNLRHHHLLQLRRAVRWRDGPMGTASTTGHGGRSARSLDLIDFPWNLVRSFPHHSTYKYSDEDQHLRSGNPSRYHSTPKMDFPKFDGTDPTIWKDNCEMYFEIYGISEMMKVKFAMLNFIGNAALWLKTVQSKQYIIHWEDLYRAVESYWGKNKFNLLMRQILTIK
jgi:hypothetical protein